jgi:putative sterol carrier protein
MNVTCRQVFEGMEAKFQELALKDVHGVFQFHIRGDGGGNWHAVCTGSDCRVREGVHGRPDVVIHASDRTVEALVNKRISPIRAFLTGRVRMKGDVPKMVRLKTLLNGRV